MVGIWEYSVDEFHCEIRNRFNEFITGEPIEFEEVVVFGSYGRGAAGQDSDIDVLIVVSNTDSYSDVERRDKFSGFASRLETEISSFPGSIAEMDVLISSVWNRDKVLYDCMDEVPREELASCPCLAYNMTTREQIETISP